MNSKLGKRLNYLKTFYQDEEYVYDMACDHGKLGLSLLSSTKIKQLFLIDQSKEVMDKLVELYADIPRVTFHLTKAQKTPNILSPNLIYIAGIGGSETRSILEALSDENLNRVVISPHKNIWELRKWIYHSKYNLADEGLVFENNHFYQVLELSQKKSTPFNQEESYYGSKIWNLGELSKSYYYHLKKSLASHRSNDSVKLLDYLSIKVHSIVN